MPNVFALPLRSVASALRCLCAPLPLRSVASALRCLCAPLPLRSVASALRLVSLMLAAPPAPAGTYTLTYSGTGQSVSVGVNVPGGTYTQPYSGAYGGGGSTSWSKPGNSVTCSGSITATATWQPSGPGDLPPASAIVQETGTASWTGTGIIVPTGQCDDGQHDAEVDTVTPPPHPGPPTSASGVSTGVHYWVKSNPGMSFSLTPGASASVSDQMTAGGGSASVSYTASVTPVTVNLGGTYDPIHSDYHVLTGQQITATLTGIPTSYPVTKYTWSQPSATCFKTYNENATSNQLVALGSADLTGPASGSKTVSPLAFYDSAQENLTVTCAVTMTAPDGTTVLNASAVSPQINVLKPTLTNWGIAEGYVQPNNTANSSTFGLYGNLSGTGNSTNGMIWSNVTVNVPAPFSGNGQCTFTQLLNPNRIAYVSGVSKPQVPFNGILGIDGSFNYGSSWGVTAAGNDVDDPNQPLYYVSGLTEFNDSDAFTTYVMYQPSGGVWVPLEKILWMWSVTLDWQPQTSQFNLTASYPHTAGQAGTPAHVPISDPPQWTVIHPSQPH